MTAAEHSALLRAIVQEYSRGDTRLFITNSGQAWQGTILSRTSDTLILRYPRLVHFGIKGMSDLNGITLHGRYVAIEGKTGSGKLKVEQAAFLRMIQERGGISGVARSVDDARIILKGS
jgi:VRR-NUC domain